MPLAGPRHRLTPRASRDGGWAVLDDKGAVLIAVGARANGVAMFSRGMIFK